MARNFTINGPKAAQDTAEHAVFGRNITQDEYGDLVGDITGNASGTVDFNTYYAGFQKQVAIRIHAKTPLFSTTVRLNPNEFYYSDIRVQAPGHKTGLTVFRLLADTALGFHIPCIYAVGERTVSANPAIASWGYYVYPRYGFDADIPQKVLPLDPAFLGLTRLSQLMSTPAGRTEWRTKGDTVKDLVFDLLPNSQCWQTLNSLP